eukprot:214887-Amphidinium_carterae.2
MKVTDLHGLGEIIPGDVVKIAATRNEVSPFLGLNHSSDSLKHFWVEAGSVTQFRSDPGKNFGTVSRRQSSRIETDPNLLQWPCDKLSTVWPELVSLIQVGKWIYAGGEKWQSTTPRAHG